MILKKSLKSKYLIFSFIGTILLSLIFAFFPKTSEAVLWGGGRTNGVRGSVYYDSSVATYGYTGYYDKARDYWNAGTTSVVNLWKSSSREKYSDVYFVGSAFSGNGHLDYNVYGLTYGYVYDSSGTTARDIGDEVMTSNIDFAVVSIYHDAMNRANEDGDSVIGMNYSERVENAAHEIGHSIKMAHSYYYSRTVMIPGQKELPSSIESYDLSEVQRKWGY